LINFYNILVLEKEEIKKLMREKSKQISNIDIDKLKFKELKQQEIIEIKNIEH